MPRFSIQVSQDRVSNAEIAAVFDSEEAARQEALALCADLGRDIFADIKDGSAWQMNVTDETGIVVIQIRVHSRISE
jgi:hypothetical protein